MKPVHTSLLIAACLLAGPSFGADDLCAVNLQKLEERSLGMPLGEPLEQQVESLRDAAIQAQYNNDPQRCVAQSAKALQLLDNSNRDGAGPD